MSIVKFNGGDSVTMTSLELVDFINQRRAEDGPILDHADFMKKVPRVLKKDAGNFSDIYLDTMNRRQKCYRFPKRESCLMAMSYSYEMQAAVFDYMTELEQRLAQQNAFALPRTRAEALRLAADLEEQNEVLALENQQQAAKIESLENFFMAGETPFQFVKRLNGVNCSLISHTLMQMGWVFNDSDSHNRPHYRVYSAARAKKWLNEKPRTIRGEGESTFIRYDLVLLIDGAKKLHDLYMNQKLPMKKTWDGRFSYMKFTSETSL
ncbi:hypothetical protein ABQX22_18345 [Xanthomonas sp. WHRI 1810A]|uniref:hypothetical protein n=1 Tax=Xanthomonas sp. WHRI 1810A TaxID=3161565 RepID=UPI0032E85E78